MASDILLVHCTLPGDDGGHKAAALARALLSEQLVACVNLVPGVRSLYRWQGELCDDAEILALMKTTADRFDALRARILALHPYECPEIIATPLAEGHAAYLDWVRASTTP